MKCDKCNGTGEAPLPPYLEETLTILRSNSPKYDGVDADFIRHVVKNDVSTQAISNRLAALLKLGLATRFRSGKFWLYKAAPAKPATRRRKR